MFTRIKKEEALDQFVRGRIYGFIEAHPGTHYSDIMKHTGVGNGTLSHHLTMLEKMNMIKSRREGMRFRAFYTTGMQFPAEDHYRLTDLQSKILQIIRQNRGITQKEITEKLNEKQQTINYNVKTMERNGLIQLKKVGRTTYCYPYDDQM